MFQAGCEAVRIGQRQVEPRRRVLDPGWVEAGRPAGATTPERQQVRRGPARVADGEAEVAQRSFVGVDAQDFCASRGALKREPGAQRAGGGRIGPETGVEQSEPGAGGKQRIALPCPSACPRPGRDLRRRRRGVPFRGFRLACLGSRALRGRRGKALLNIRRQLGEEVEIGANHVGMMSLARRFVTLCGEECAPLVVGWRCPISFHYRT
jgi:hypothetical protein